VYKESKKDNCFLETTPTTAAAAAAQKNTNNSHRPSQGGCSGCTCTPLGGEKKFCQA